ncbi:hypothetical protein PSAB6_180111 [Paraburkholderia sabiae]|nr:hypothetical protein PSAB6_180111 [Paraburkholderia sabiae]
MPLKGGFVICGKDVVLKAKRQGMRAGRRVKQAFAATYAALRQTLSAQ